MPSKSKKQADFMRAIAHGWEPSRMKNPPSRAVAREYMEADKREGNYQLGGMVRRAMEMARQRAAGPTYGQPGGPGGLQFAPQMRNMMQRGQVGRGQWIAPIGGQQVHKRLDPAMFQRLRQQNPSRFMARPGIMPGRQFIPGQTFRPGAAFNRSSGSADAGRQAGPTGGPRIPPSLRGYLQKMRMMNRPGSNVGAGVNRVGQADQQGGLARALQRGTGRPPMSRRSSFPGRS